MLSLIHFNIFLLYVLPKRKSNLCILKIILYHAQELENIMKVIEIAIIAFSTFSANTFTQIFLYCIMPNPELNAPQILLFIFSLLNGAKINVNKYTIINTSIFDII